MNVLFVAPVEIGSGETITALHMAERVLAMGGDVRILASPFAASLIGTRLADRTTMLSRDGDTNRELWSVALLEFRPEAVVFADFPLLSFSRGVCPLANPDWIRRLDDLDACLVTLDHTGYAQRPMGVFFGPPHLSFQYESIPAIPRRMQVLLPCPMHEPSAVAGRRGHPFRYWDVPLTIPEHESRAVRRRFLARNDDLLLVHAVARWAWEGAKSARLPYYDFLPRIIAHYLAGLDRTVTLVSVNNGQLLETPPGSNLRVVNLPSMSSLEYDRLVHAADLLLTENKISISMGKAICAHKPCVSLRNSFSYRELLGRLTGELRDIVLAMDARRSGAVFRYGVFPLGMDEEVDMLGLYRNNTIVDGFREIELFGGDETRDRFLKVLQDEVSRDELRTCQRRYTERLQQLDYAEDVLAHLISEPSAAGLPVS